MDLRNKKITVVGLGNSGVGSALLLYDRGAVVSVTDNADTEEIRKNAKLLEEKYIDLEIGKHTEEFLHDTDLLVVSPGVEKSSMPIHYAGVNNIPVISELELGYQFCKGPIVAVTGTNGKSTVVSLLGEILENARIPREVCGNIGNSLSGEVRGIAKGTVVILEVSSFQLEWIEGFRPRISVILNITEDHLDRYSSFEAYVADKKKVFKNQQKGDIVILNYEDKTLRDLAETERVLPEVFYFSARRKVKGVYLDKGEVMICLKNKTRRLFNLKDPGLKGKHNIENILAATLGAALLGVKTGPIEKTVRDFKTLPHRFEKVAVVGGIEFIDDSKATNIDSASKALESLDRPAILIAGGKDKNLSYSKALPAVKKNVKKAILIGEAGAKMRDIFKDFIDVEEKSTLEEAVLAAYENASPGDCVLLSPMCSSFDMFRDYKERGAAFRDAVEKLKGRQCGG